MLPRHSSLDHLHDRNNLLLRRCHRRIHRERLLEIRQRVQGIAFRKHFIAQRKGPPNFLGADLTFNQKGEYICPHVCTKNT